MSMMYNRYLQKHINGVCGAFRWIQEYAPEILWMYSSKITDLYKLETEIINEHDTSKREDDEYLPYDKYYYGNNKSSEVVDAYNIAWLKHLHRNPHHWQHWVLINDDDGMKALDMPMQYIIEMICDWWSFSFDKGNLYEIFDWYNDPERQAKFMFSDTTKKNVDKIMQLLRQNLERTGGYEKWSKLGGIE